MINSCISKLDRTGIRKSTKSCEAKQQEEGKTSKAVSRFRKAATRKILIEDSKMCNTAADSEGWKSKARHDEVN